MPEKELTEILFFILVSTSLLILLITFVTLLVLRYRHKQKLHASELEEQRIHHINELVSSRMEIQEQTLDRVSREIHDNIGQRLTLAKLQINLLKEPGKHSYILEKTSLLLGCVLSDLRALTKSMNSEIVLENGFIAALRNEVSHLQKFGAFNVHLDIIGEPPSFDAKTELLLFRITQEAVNNILKHSQANNVYFILDFSENHLVFNIKDDGVGFCFDELVNKGMGLLNMEKRSNLMGASYFIESKKGEGTIINLKLPFNENIGQMHSYAG